MDGLFCERVFGPVKNWECYCGKYKRIEPAELLMMVSAFGGKDFVLKAYKEAMKKKYNFSSYGDAMMII